MKKALKKIGAIIMSFVVVLSTMSFSINQHFCGDLLVESAMFSKAHCGNAMDKPDAEENCVILDDLCCDDEIKQVDFPNNFENYLSNLNPEQQQFVVAFTYTYLNLFNNFNKKEPISSYYKIPLVERDLNILYQTFRI